MSIPCLQKKHYELLQIALQRQKCLMVQYETLSKIIQSSSQLSTEKLNKLLQNTQSKINYLKQQWRTYTQLNSQFLLKAQDILIHEQQRISVEQHYSERVKNLGYLLYDKEVDMAVDHIGKIQEEQPRYQKIKKFQYEQYDQIYVMQITKQIGDLKKGIIKLQKLKQEQSDKEDKSEEATQGTCNPEDSKKLSKIVNQGNKAFQTEEELIGNLNFHIMKQLYGLINTEIQNNRTLKQELKQLKEYSIELCQERSRLTKMYYNQ